MHFYAVGLDHMFKDIEESMTMLFFSKDHSPRTSAIKNVMECVFEIATMFSAHPFFLALLA
jgi:hypothetical protein